MKNTFYSQGNPYSIVRTTASTFTASAGELIIADETEITLPTDVPAGSVIAVRSKNSNVTTDVVAGSASVDGISAGITHQEAETGEYVYDGSNWFLRNDIDIKNSAIPDRVLTQDLIAWYRFEDGDARDYTAILKATFSDSIAQDGIVNGATFQSSGGVTDFKNGANSGAFSFDGDDSIDIPTLSPKTIMGWVKTDTTYTGNDGNKNAVIYPDGSREVTLWFGNWTQGFSGETISVGGDLYTPTVNAGVWNHWALTDTGGDPAWDLYRNGNKLTRQGTKGTSVSNVTAPFYIGRRDDGVFADADVDDVRFYDRALTSSEISDIYNATEP